MNSLSDYEPLINRGALSFRSKRLDAVIRAINSYLANPSGDGLEQIEAAVDTWQQQDPLEYSNRGAALQSELDRLLRSEGIKWGWGAGRIRLVDPSSNPSYEPGLWNDRGRIQYSTNCYAYACNDPYSHAYGGKPQPGMHMEQPGPKGPLGGKVTNSSVRLAVMQDDQSRNLMQTQRLIPLIRMRSDIKRNTPIDVVNVKGYYLIALVVARGRDYHWYRQDDTGMWSHKPGHDPATNLDASRRTIADPRACNLGIYRFTNFYYAPKSGVRTASLGDWSNPDWQP
jgi:hypothetical protein